MIQEAINTSPRKAERVMAAQMRAHSDGTPGNSSVALNGHSLETVDLGEQAAGD